MKTKRRSAARVLSLILSIILVFGLLPAAAFADSPPPNYILITVSNPITINQIDITGVEEPVAGAAPDISASTATTGVISPASVTWNPAANPFRYDTAYTASITISAQFAYEFTSGTAVTVNGVPADTVVLNSNGTLTATYAFDKTVAAPLVSYDYATSIDSGSTYVIVDKGSTNYALTTSVANSNYLAAAEVTVNGSQLNPQNISGNMLWTFTTDSSGFNVKNGSSFLTRPSKGSDKITLKTSDDGSANTDWQYDSTNHVLKIKGSSSTYYLYQTSGSGNNYFAVASSDTNAKNIYLYKRTETLPTTIGEVEVTDIDVPVAGNSPDTSASGSTEGVSASAVTWEPADNPYGFDTVYQATITLTAKAGYVFASNASVSINGHTSQISNRTTSTLTASYSFDATQAAVDAEPPRISGQPQSVTVSEGESAKLTATASVIQGTLSYQWYKNTEDNNTNGTLISGAKSAAYSAPTDRIGILYYYCVVTNTDNMATGRQTAEIASQTCSVTVQTQQIVITALSSNSSYGTVTGGGRYDKGASVILTASPKPKYCFVCWKKNGTEVSRSLIYTFTALSSASYTAQFAAAIPVGISCKKTDVSIYGASNGAVTITASGGDSGSYEYSLNGGSNWQGSGEFSGLAASTYTAAVRDAQNPGNTATCSVAVGQPKHMGNFAAKKLPSRANTGTALTIVPPAAPKRYTVVLVTYSSSNPSVASVDSGGTVTFLAGGKATIITKTVIQTTDKKGKVKTKTTTIKKAITVKQPVASITLNVIRATIVRTQKLKLAASAAPVTASKKKVTWKSSNSKVASVSSAGVVTGKAGGTAIITCIAKDGSGVTASCIVTVTPIYPTGIKMSKQTLTLKTGKTALLKAPVSPKKTDYKTVTWFSSNSAIVTVDAKGRVKGITPGTAVITAATSNGYTVSCTVTVK